MSSIEDYSGLCGIIPTFAGFDNRIRCKYEFAHGGPCSFEKHRRKFSFCYAGSFHGPELPEESFLNSVLSHMPYDHHSVMIESNNTFTIRK